MMGEVVHGRSIPLVTGIDGCTHSLLRGSTWIPLSRSDWRSPSFFWDQMNQYLAQHTVLCINFGRLRSVQLLCQVNHLDFLTLRQIRNRVCPSQAAMIRPCRQIELTHPCPHHTLTFILRLAKNRISPRAYWRYKQYPMIRNWRSACAEYRTQPGYAHE